MLRTKSLDEIRYDSLDEFARGIPDTEDDPRPCQEISNVD